MNRKLRNKEGTRTIAGSTQRTIKEFISKYKKTWTKIKGKARGTNGKHMGKSMNCAIRKLNARSIGQKETLGNPQ